MNELVFVVETTPEYWDDEENEEGFHPEVTEEIDFILKYWCVVDGVDKLPSGELGIIRKPVVYCMNCKTYQIEPIDPVRLFFRPMSPKK